MSDDNVQVMPVCQVVMLTKENAPVGVEVVWEGTVTQKPDACMVLNMVRMALNDAGWILRQVERTERVQPEGDGDTVQ
jgi:hypothetical protein